VGVGSKPGCFSIGDEGWSERAGPGYWVPVGQDWGPGQPPARELAPRGHDEISQAWVWKGLSWFSTWRCCRVDIPGSKVVGHEAQKIGARVDHQLKAGGRREVRPCAAIRWYARPGLVELELY